MGTERRIGLALGGGGVLGAAHIGVLNAFEEAEIPIDCLAGTSIGSFVAALYAFETPLDRIEEIMLDLNWLDITNLNPSSLGLFTNDKLGTVIEEHLGSVEFSEASRAIAFVATDISTGEKVVLESGSVKDAVMASCAIPGLFAPMEVGERLLVDGGLVENVPLETLRAMNVETVIGVDLTEKLTLAPPANLVDVVLNTIYILLARARAHELDRAHLSITPDISSYSGVKMDKVAELIRIGYDAALPVVAELQ